MRNRFSRFGSRNCIASDSVSREADTDKQPAPKLRRAEGVGWALASAVAFGWVFFALGPSSEALGPAWVVWGLRIVALTLLLPRAAPLAGGLRRELGALTRG